MPLILQIVGYSNSGKTTVAEKLVQLFTRHGFKVGVVKHDVHGFEVDQPGKDTYRYRQAGGVKVGILGPGKAAFMVEREVLLEEVFEFYRDMDLILVEGFKNRPFPRIEVIRSEIYQEPFSPPELLVAVVSDLNLEVDCPVFGFGEIDNLFQFLLKYFEKGGGV
ncbi:molybdopterin-guanine dinucleotide biosynthesis protein B [Carboxydothermus islandicus]|uniref:Molybdopterin-guanine dinucleotide biosynthesis protein B n=1 Tax=Carboxydothermus islandicus TaxID=661089 RepID=A0A1L8D051_9THEO|nr:molybdopterin-guanine dinucleotide biosynthesis protein B [Carboxydothermus islandicus]GAV24576.1 molybdopterin-guanine dinucleotide biosynthesis protein B [Carboxydothermus islandicus]